MGQRRTRSIAAALLLLSCSLKDCDASSRLPLSSSKPAPILLFVGAGTSPSDVAAIEALLAHSHLLYSTADSSQLNAMSRAQLAAYRLLLIPGGDFIAMGDGLTPDTRANLHDAVQDGAGYLGICAGAFLAGKFRGGGFDLASGTKFNFYADEARGIRKAAVAIRSPGSPPLEQYWQDGPELSGWGAVAARYPDGTPAVVEGLSGRGWVLLTGVHPEAPRSWRHGMTFTTPVSASNAYAVKLIEAALSRQALARD